MNIAEQATKFGYAGVNISQVIVDRYMYGPVSQFLLRVYKYSHFHENRELGAIRLGCSVLRCR